MEVLKNTENDLQIDLRPIDCCVIALTSEVRKLRTQCVMNPLNMGMLMIFPCSKGYSIKTSETGKFIINYDGSGTLEPNGVSHWLLQTNDETASITVTFPQQVSTYSVNLSKAN